MALLAAGIRDSAAADANLAEARRLNASNPRVGTTPAVASFFKRGVAARAPLPAYVANVQTEAPSVRDADTHRMTGMVLFAEGKVQEAIAELRQGGDNPYTTLFLADAYLQLGNAKQAADERAAFFARKNFSYDLDVGLMTGVLKYRADHPK